MTADPPRGDGDVPGTALDASSPTSLEPRLCGPPAAAEDDVVVTEEGAVRGVPLGPTVVFRGIPFAEQPVGTRRWAPPSPPPCIDGVFDASAFGPRCPQLDEQGRPIGDESCLYLNVWKPSGAARSSALPVLVFIHGGGNAQGSTVEEIAGAMLYDGRFLSEGHQVVVVTTSYRLGPLGWLVHPDLDRDSALGTSGNYGTLDQIQALTWVKRNIGAFGGDPRRVMVFGESAGARDVCVLVASPLARDLFSSAIMESGACVAATRTQVLGESMEQIRRSGCERASGGEVECLRGKSAFELLLSFPPAVDVVGQSTAFQPHPDGPVLPDQPSAVIEEGRHNHVALIIGANSDETSLSAPALETEAEYRSLVTMTFGPTLGARVLEVYPASQYGTPRAAYVALTSDAKFICNARRDARAALIGQEEPVFRYFFTQGLLNAPRLRSLGAYHGLELFFVFDNLTIGNYRAAPEEQALADQIGGAWARLAAVGDPNGSDLPTWARYEGDLDNTLVLNSAETSMVDGIRTRECDFWDALY